MTPDIFGSSFAAIRAARSAGLLSGPLNGINPPNYVTGQTYFPTFMGISGSTVDTAANRLYYLPFFVWKTQAFAGAKTYNSGVGDNGETLRLGVYADDGATGGPGTLMKDFGQITLTGAAALRTAANAVTLPGPAWYWAAYHANATSTMYSLAPWGFLSGVGESPIPPHFMMVGLKLSVAPTADNVGRNWGLGLYVSTAYGAFASTAVAATSELSYGQTGSTDGSNTGHFAPLIGLYV